MEWVATINLILQLANKGMTKSIINRLSKYNDMIFDIQKEIDEEEAKGQLSNDRKLEELDKDLANAKEAFDRQVKLELTRAVEGE